MCQALQDSGADICAAGSDFLKVIKKSTHDLENSDVWLEAVNGQQIKPVGSVVIKVNFMGERDDGKDPYLQGHLKISDLLASVQGVGNLP